MGSFAIEQKGFGVRSVEKTKCNDLALQKILRGSSLTGQRVFDVMRAVDFIKSQKDLDSSRIACMGHSTGGTVSFYAACLDPRISMAITSCSFCTFQDSWLKHPHCACGYIPNIASLGDMPDLAGLIAPRKLLIVAGEKDHLADIKGVKKAFKRSCTFFKNAGCTNHIQMVTGKGGHDFFPEAAWPRINRMSGLTRSLG